MKHKLEKIIELHEVMKNAFFFNSDLGDITLYEKAHSRITEFEYDKHIYTIEQSTKVAERVIYKVAYYCDGERIKKDIRFVKQILSKLE